MYVYARNSISNKWTSNDQSGRTVLQVNERTNGMEMESTLVKDKLSRDRFQSLRVTTMRSDLATICDDIHALLY